MAVVRFCDHCKNLWDQEVLDRKAEQPYGRGVVTEMLGFPGSDTDRETLMAEYDQMISVLLKTVTMVREGFANTMLPAEPFCSMPHSFALRDTITEFPCKLPHIGSILHSFRFVCGEEGALVCVVDANRDNTILFKISLPEGEYTVPLNIPIQDLHYSKFGIVVAEGNLIEMTHTHLYTVPFSGYLSENWSNAILPRLHIMCLSGLIGANSDPPVTVFCKDDGSIEYQHCLYDPIIDTNPQERLLPADL